jgi:putative redox protein
MKITPKSIVIMKISALATSHARTEIKVRDLVEVIDEPIARGRTNEGASPTETLLVALARCTTVVAHRIAEKLGFNNVGLSVALEADFDRRGVMLEEQLDVPFPEIRATIKLTTDSDESLIETLKSDLQLYCPIANIIRQSGTNLIET